MAKSEPNMPDDVKNTPEQEQAAQVTEAPAPGMTAEEAATLAHEGEAALREIGEEQLEPPAPFDIPAPDNVVVPFDKINEIMSEKQEAEKPDKAPNKRGRRGKTVQQEAREAGAEDTRQEQLSKAASGFFMPGL